jgi:hypothetical protein
LSGGRLTVARHGAWAITGDMISNRKGGDAPRVDRAGTAP